MDPKDLESTEQAQQPNSDDGMVDIHDASIEDLDAAIANAQAHEQSAPPDDSSDATVTDAPPSDATQQPNGQPDAGAKAPTDGVAAQGADASKPAKTYTQEEIQAILAENERQKKEGNQKELFIQHRGNELGKLKTDLAVTRRQLSDARAQLANGLEDRFAENPVQASNDRDRIKEIDQQLEGLDVQEERASKIVEAQTFFLRHVDTEKVSLEDVAEVLKSDGVDERFVAQFKSNPWEFTTPEALVQMGKRAFDRKQFTQADSDRRILAKHVLYLNGELAKLKARPGQVMAQVQKNLNQAPPLTASSGASPRTARDLDPTRMSIAELDAALKNAGMH